MDECMDWMDECMDDDYDDDGSSISSPSYRYHNGLRQHFSSQHPSLGEFVHVAQMEHNATSSKRRRLLDPAYQPALRGAEARQKELRIQEEKNTSNHLTNVFNGLLHLEPREVAHYLKTVGCPLAVDRVN